MIPVIFAHQIDSSLATGANQPEWGAVEFAKKRLRPVTSPESRSVERTWQCAEEDNDELDQDPGRGVESPLWNAPAAYCSNRTPHQPRETKEFVGSPPDAFDAPTNESGVSATNLVLLSEQ
jgi:hypothetical protein